MNPERCAEKVLRLLRSVGIQSEFCMYEFPDARGVTRYAGLYVRLLEERERELERVLTRSFNPENGFYVDFLVSKVRDNGRHGFYIEAAPYNPITEDFIREQGELTARTNEFLTSLSRVIKEFLRKNVHRR